MSVQLESYDVEKANPLDNVEDILNSHNWVFNRLNDSELMVEVAGKHCDYRLFFIWQEDMSALQFCCQYDLTISKNNHDAAAQALMSLNESLWMGHFDIPKDTRVPSFRHTCLLRGIDRGSAGSEHIEDMVDISMVQCERFYSVFHFLSSTEVANDQTLSLALMDTSGEA